jgi:protein-S-isoprenylcysteine O-methyltransferase Ste14
VVDPLYRPAKPAQPWWNVVKTLFEVLTFWFVVLLALPIGISIVEVDLAIQRFPGFPRLAAILFGASSVLGLWAALTLAIAGRGTPLPIDEARRFVTSGPYAFVRNPLTISIMLQGTAIALALGSIPVSIYVAVLGAWLYFYARPREERHLKQRFGKQWTDYIRHVRAYRPRVTRYKGAS